MTSDERLLTATATATAATSPIRRRPYFPLLRSSVSSPLRSRVSPRARRIDRHRAPHLLDVRVRVVLPITHQEPLGVGALSVVGLSSKLFLCSALDVFSEWFTSVVIINHAFLPSVSLLVWNCARFFFCWVDYSYNFSYVVINIQNLRY